MCCFTQVFVVKGGIYLHTNAYALVFIDIHIPVFARHGVCCKAVKIDEA